MRNWRSFFLCPSRALWSLAIPGNPVRQGGIRGIRGFAPGSRSWPESPGDSPQNCLERCVWQEGRGEEEEEEWEDLSVERAREEEKKIRIRKGQLAREIARKLEEQSNTEIDLGTGSACPEDQSTCMSRASLGKGGGDPPNPVVKPATLRSKRKNSLDPLTANKGRRMSAGTSAAAAEYKCSLPLPKDSLFN